MSSNEALKRAAAEAAVMGEVRSGMRLGLGSGSTMRYVVEALGAALREGRLRDVVGVPTSQATETQARTLGIPLVELHEVETLDVALDGADEVDPALNLIKGLGGALLREKMVAQAARRFAIVADESKRVARLGTKAPLPVEVVRFGWQAHLPFLDALGAEATRREEGGEPYLTDNGNYILHLAFGPAGIEDPQVIEWLLLARAGLVDHGLFLDMAEVAYLAGDAGVEVVRRADG